MLYAICIMRELLPIDAGNTADSRHSRKCFSVSDKGGGVHVIINLIISAYQIIRESIAVGNAALNVQVDSFREIILELLKCFGRH